MRALRKNLKKARRTWARLSNVLKGENAPPAVCGMFYKAAIQSILLYGSESWVITTAMKRILRGFHIRAAYRMAKEHRPRKLDTGEWYYPPSEAVLNEVKLYEIEHYIEKRRNSIADYVATRDIFQLCNESVRRRGTGHRKVFWWNQCVSDDLEIDEFEDLCDD